MCDDEIRGRLSGIYEEIMWLAKRPFVTPAAARSWYTHVAAVALRTHIRRFTGKVSKEAILNYNGHLRLEHFKRIQTNLTQLVDRHRSENITNPEEFIDCVIDSEQVHVVTTPENYAIMRARGDYAIAGVELVDWNELRQEVRASLWARILQGRVANALDFIH